MLDKTTYLAYYEEESLRFWQPPPIENFISNNPYIIPPPQRILSSGIPTLGAPATVIDQYRMHAIQSTNLPEIGAAFTDIEAISCLSKIAEGGVSSLQDNAEIALQAFLLNEIVHVVIPTPKVDYGNGFIAYHRLDESARTSFGFELMKVANGKDFLIAPEFIIANEGVILETTSDDKAIIGHRLETLASNNGYWNQNVSDAMNVSISQHGVPAYLANPLLTKSRRGEGFVKDFYKRLRVSWDDMTGGMPPIICTFNIPPFLAIVLNRLNNRQDLLAILYELRDELKEVRKELRQFNNIVTAATTQQEAERRTKRIQESFDAIMAESGLTSAERTQRSILSVQKIVRPVFKFMAGFVMNTGGVSIDQLSELSSLADVMEDESIIDRTVTARTFSQLVKVETVQSLVKHHFSEAEINAIEASA